VDIIFTQHTWPRGTLSCVDVGLGDKVRVSHMAADDGGSDHPVNSPDGPVNDISRNLIVFQCGAVLGIVKNLMELT